MGWDGDHAHAFTVGSRHYGDPFFRTPDFDDEEDIRCGAALATGASIGYRYDLGACWEHTIKCERMLDLSADGTYPVCVAGTGDAPVEDWTGGPELKISFDQDAINRQLAGIGSFP